MAAYLAPERIPTVLLETVLDNPGQPADRKRLLDGVKALFRFSLADVTDDAISVHRLLQKVVRDDARERGDESGVAHALNALTSAFPEDRSAPRFMAVVRSTVAPCGRPFRNLCSRDAHGRCARSLALDVRLLVESRSVA